MCHPHHPLCRSAPQDTPVITSHVAAALDCLALSADGLWAVGGSADGRAWLWHMPSGALVRVWECHYKGVTAAAWSPCGTLLVTGGGDGLLHAWATPTLVDGAVVAAGAPVAPVASAALHALAVTAVAFAPHCSSLSAIIVSVSADHTMRMWRLGGAAAAVGAALPDPLAAPPLALHHLASCDVGASASAVAVWDTGVAPPASLRAAVATADGRVVVAEAGPGDAAAAASSRITLRTVWTLRGHVGAVRCLAVTLDGAALVTGGDDGIVRVWDIVSSGKQTGTFAEHKSPVTNVLVVPAPEGVAFQGRRVVSAHVTASAGASATATSEADALAAVATVAGLSHMIPGGGAGLAVSAATLAASRTRPPPMWRKHVHRAGVGAGAGAAGDGVAPPAATDVVLIGRAVESHSVTSCRRAMVADGLALLRAMALAGGMESAAASAAAVEAPPPAVLVEAAAAGADTDAEMATLRERVAALEAENGRWRDVNNKLMARLRGGAAPAVDGSAETAAAAVTGAGGGAEAVAGVKRPRG